MKKIAPSQKLEQAFFQVISVSGKPLRESARLGAQLMLQKALEEEVSDFLEAKRLGAERSSAYSDRRKRGLPAGDWGEAAWQPGAAVPDT